MMVNHENCDEAFLTSNTEDLYIKQNLHGLKSPTVWKDVYIQSDV